ncbi:MAG: SpoIIE family protein phosphatase [Acidobacteriota bacterium]
MRLLSWFRERTLFQKITLVLLALAVLALVATGSGISGVVFFAILFAISAIFGGRRSLLWRVRNRLLVSYFFFGVIPVVLIGLMLLFSVELLLGQYAAERAKQGMNRQLESISSSAQDLALAAGSANVALLDQLRQRVPRMQAVVRSGARSIALPAGAAIPAIPDWIKPDFMGLFQVEGKYYAGARSHAGEADAFAYLALDDATLASLAPGVTIAGIFSEDEDFDVQFNYGSRIYLKRKDGKQEVQSSTLAEPKGSWDRMVAGMLPWSVQLPGQSKDTIIVLLTRPATLMAGVVNGRMAGLIAAILLIVGGFFLFVELISLVWSFVLTRTITRSVHDLHLGTLRIAEGDFTYQIPVRGQHQLSDLAASFNGMTSQIVKLFGEVRKKEKLEAELEIARQVQQRLFPRTVPQLETLELAGICIPGRYISGDYYDFVRLDRRWTAIALGDVSGKGVSAALLMASIQSSLHAQLSFRGEAVNPVLSTATLMALIGQQLYENTPAEKYATFFCSTYDEETRTLLYTNAGHLRPILVREGKWSTLAGDGMVVGLLPNVKYEQQEFQLQAGDLLAIFSDGIPEAEDAAGKEYGEDRLADLLTQHADKPLNEIIAIVTKSVDDWAADPASRDDTTIVLARCR